MGDGRWEIEGGPNELDALDYDGTVWKWRLKRQGFPATVHVRITGTALAMDDSALPPRVAAARGTDGRSEVERVLEWEHPPSVIELGSQTHEPIILGGDPPEWKPENALLDLADWFEARGVLLTFTGRAWGVSPDGVPAYTQKTAHLIARESEELLHSVEGPTELEAARSALRWYVEQHGGEAPEPLPATAWAERRELVEEFNYHMIWTKPTAGGNEWMVRVYDDSGELIDAGLGDNIDDALLGVIERLLPPQD